MSIELSTDDDGNVTVSSSDNTTKLTFTAQRWGEFIQGVKDGEFDLLDYDTWKQH